MPPLTIRPNLPLRSKRAATSLMVAMHEDVSPGYDELHQVLAEDLTFWALLYPLADGIPPTTLGAVRERLCDLHDLEREIMTVSSDNGAAYESAGLNVRHNMKGRLPFIAAISVRAVDSYIARPRLVLSDRGNSRSQSEVVRH